MIVLGRAVLGRDKYVVKKTILGEAILKGNGSFG